MHRPPGLSLAILAVALLYGAMPLVEVYFLRRIDAVSEEAFILGGVGIDTWTVLEGLYGGLVLVVCILAWWGRPAWIRYVFMVAVLLPAAVMLYRVIQTWLTPADPIAGGQAQEIAQGFALPATRSDPGAAVRGVVCQPRPGARFLPPSAAVGAMTAEPGDEETALSPGATRVTGRVRPA